MKKMRTEDRRIQKTQSLLRGALLSLVAEKPYDSIVVKEILDRANVGRSTFYTHFRDKDDLLVTGIYDMLGPMPLAARTGARGVDWILWFSLPIFEHHYHHAHAWGDRIGTKGRTILHEHLRRVLNGHDRPSNEEGLSTRTPIPPTTAARDYSGIRRFDIRPRAELVAGYENAAPPEGHQ